MRRYCCLGLLLLFVAGCGVRSAVSNQAASEAAMATVLQKGNPAIAAAGAELPAGEKQGPRKVIYKGSLDLVVKDFAEAEQGLKGIIEKSQAFIDELSEDRRAGSQRYAKWVVRVPADGVQKFLDQIGSLGSTQYRGLSADDVTEEFVDLAARMKSKRQLETRLLELVASKAGDIRDLTSLESELSRVREEIERMEGRVRYLSDRVAMSTITITMREAAPLVAPAPVTPPTFVARISQVFFQSLTALRELAEEIVLCVVAVAPFVIVLLVLASPFVWLLCRHVRRRARRMTPQII
jgi:hypothetical protein